MPVVTIEYGSVAHKDKIERIKYLRKAANLPLRDAFSAINRMDVERSITVGVSEEDIENLIAAGFVVDGVGTKIPSRHAMYLGDNEYMLTLSLTATNKIMAIKVLRGLTGLGLKDAKDKVDEMMPRWDDPYRATVKVKMLHLLSDSDLALLDEAGFVVSGGIRNHFTDVEDLFTI